MTCKSPLLAGCLALCTFAWANACDKPADTATQSAVQVPDYTEAVADEAPDPQETAMRTTWQNYQDSLVDALSHSSDPRDWALTAMAKLKFGVDDHTADEHLIERAMRAAPNDVLVQWIAMNRGETTHDTALQTLHGLEPDNAAVWIEDLNAATKRKDDAGVNAALAKASAARRYDSHIVDFLKAATEIYLHNPVPDAYLAAAPKEMQPLGKDEFAYAYAGAITMAVALSSFQHLVNACRIDPASGKHSARAADCAAIGRLLMAAGDTLIANRIGASLLRVSRAYTEEDVGLGRDLDWVYQRYTDTLSEQRNKDVGIAWVAHYHDWIDTRSELESLRRELVRNGIAATPPADWVDGASLFSAERRHADAEWFEKNASK
jgi:hypothetical protein